MSFRGSQYPSGYGNSGQMPMPMPGLPNQTNISQPYQMARQTTPYPVPVSGATTSEIDNALKQLTDDLIKSVINSARNEDLEGLINNDEKLNELIMDSQITKNLNQKREEMANFNKDLAVANLSLRPELETLKLKLIELSTKQNELRDSYMNSRSKLSNTTSIDTIFAILQAAAAEKETASDQIKTDFYDGEVTVDEFMKHFIHERKLYQLRKIKSEKMKFLIQTPALAGATNMPGYPVNQAVGYQRSHHPPYPTHPAIPAHPTAIPITHAVPTSTSVPPPGSYYGGYNMR